MTLDRLNSEERANLESRLQKIKSDFEKELDRLVFEDPAYMQIEVEEWIEDEL